MTSARGPGGRRRSSRRRSRTSPWLAIESSRSLMPADHVNPTSSMYSPLPSRRRATRTEACRARHRSGGLSGAGCSLSGCRLGEQLGRRTGCRCVGRTTCRPSRRACRSPARRGRADGAGRRRRRRRTTRAPTACAAATMPASSGTVPIAFEAAVTATQRVRSDSTASTAAAGSASVSGVGLREAHGRAGALGRDHPRPHVGVVVEPRDHDLVARRQRPPDGGRKPHRHRGHRGAEGDAARLGAEQAARPRRAPPRRTRRSHARPRRRRRGWRRARSASTRPSPRWRCRPSACRPARPAAPSHPRAPGKRSRFIARSAAVADELRVARIAEQRVRGRPTRPSASRRPRRWARSRGVAVRLHQPVADDLRAALVVAVGDGRELVAQPAAQPDLLLDLAQRGLLPALAGVELALGQRPVVVARAVHDDQLDGAARRRGARPRRPTP